MGAAITLKNVTKQYENFTLDHINLEIPKGCITGLVGENGAGKTTMLKLILDMIALDEGEILIDQVSKEQLPRDWKNDFGIIITDLDFAGMMTAKEFGNCFKHSFCRWQQQTYETYLHQFKIDKKKKIKDYSKGMKMKLNLAAALSHDARYLILDEPTSGLDPVVRDEILDILLEFIQDEEHAVLLSSHITSDLEKISDYIAFLHEGKLEFFMNKDELLYDYGVLHCSEEMVNRIPKEAVVAIRRGAYQCQVLVKGRQHFQADEGDYVLDAVSIEEMILFLVKGERR